MTIPGGTVSSYSLIVISILVFVIFVILIFSSMDGFQASFPSVVDDCPCPSIYARQLKCTQYLKRLLAADKNRIMMHNIHH
jgi:hypothetical protein